MQREVLLKNKNSKFTGIKYKSSPVLLNHYSFARHSLNIKNAVAGEYKQKSFKRLFADRPSYTACYGNNEVHIHPWLDRRLSVREAARIQNFPDYWTFLGGLSAEFKQIGNAVPPSLAFAVVKSVLEHVSIENKNAVSLFSGIGGLDIGAEEAGLKIKSALEINEYCVRGLHLNKIIGLRTGIHSFLKHSAIIQADLSDRKCTSRDFIEQASRKKLGKIEVVIGGPPCQAFSSAGTRKGLLDERGKLYIGYLNVLKALTPHTFIFENVIGLKRMERGAVLEKISKDFLRLGYNLRVIHLNAKSFGIPQSRDRLFLIGTFDDQLVLDSIERKLNAIDSAIIPVRTVLKDLPPCLVSPRDHSFDFHYLATDQKWALGGAVYNPHEEKLINSKW
ncbi:DNA (cytosine-5-)-methyltransferase [Bdellovibrio bacteriovorus]|uniref:DNA (cytosine-5-)-methyltransferase n=1 Tax=Bdellovibrio bacteriovorus TaxID=959 RepID=UPI0035A72AA0